MASRTEFRPFRSLSLAGTTRLRSLVVAALLAMQVRAFAQVALYEHSDFQHNWYWLQRNTPLCSIEDLDGDGVRDYVIGSANGPPAGPHAGLATVYSGRNGGILMELYGELPERRFGQGVAALPDIDGDGLDEIAVSAPFPTLMPIVPGYVDVYSGANGARLWRAISPWSHTRMFGCVLRPIEDQDGDGVSDLVVSGPTYQGGFSGSVALLSGATGLIVRTWNGTTQFGFDVDVVPDANGDGFDDILVGSPYEMAGNGVVRAYSARTGILLATFSGPLGYSLGTCVAGLGDVDGDGIGDFAMGDGHSGSAANLHIEVRSGANGAVLWSRHAAPLQMGLLVERFPDLDGDGANDVLYSAHSYVTDQQSYMAIASGRTGADLARIDPGAQGSPELYAAPAGDLNGDGICDLFYAGRDWSQGSTFFVRVALIGVTGPKHYCVAKTNSLGCVPAMSSTGVASVSVGDNFALRASNVLNSKPGVLLWGASALSTPFSGGTLCVAPVPPSIRGPSLSSGGSPPPANDCSGSYAFHFSHAFMAARGITAGTTIHAQFLSRDPGFAPPRNVGLTDALQFTVIP